MDGDALTRGVLALERAVTENQLQRARYPDDPSRFVSSEVDVDECLRALQPLAAAPEMYARFVDLGGVPTVLGLLAHENADVSASAIALLAELSDVDGLFAAAVGKDADDNAFLRALVDNEGLELLVQNLGRLSNSEDEEANAAYRTLEIFEQLVEYSPPIAVSLTQRTPLLSVLLQRVGAAANDPVKFYAAELLALLVQTDEANASLLGRVTVAAPPGGAAADDAEPRSGMLALLEACAAYRRRDAADAGEEECVENLFNCLCAALLREENRSAFHAAEGTELLVAVLRGRRFASGAALRALSFAVQMHPPAALALVEAGGLKVLFPPFMGRGLYRDKASAGSGGLKADARRMAVEHAASVVASLCLLLEQKGSVEAPADARTAQAADRVAAKFLENGFEKLDRACELLFRARDRLEETRRRVAGRRAAREGAAPAGGGAEEDAEDDAELLAGGLGDLQQLSCIVGAVFVRSRKCREHLQRRFRQEGRPLGIVGEALEGYALQLLANAPEGGGEEGEVDAAGALAVALRRKCMVWASVLC